MSVFPDSEFGARIRARLRDETLIWFTTTSQDGTPQPNPVWFLFEPETESVLIYSANNAVRIKHVAARPRVSLNFPTDPGGGDVVVLTGTAERATDVPGADRHEAFLAKYRELIGVIGSDPEKFTRDYSVPLRVRVAKARGF